MGDSAFWGRFHVMNTGASQTVIIKKNGLTACLYNIINKSLVADFKITPFGWYKPTISNRNGYS